MAKDDKPVVEFEAEPDETGGGGGGVPWHDLTEESGVEVVEGEADPAPKGPSYEDLVAQVQAERAAREKAESRVDPVAALSASLKEALAAKGEAPPTPTAPQQPWESDEDFAKRLKESFFEDPVSHLDKWSQRKLGPVMQQIASMTQGLARQNMMLDPDLGGTYRRYQGEIDRLVASRQDRFTNPEVYREVTRNVTGAHINEIIAEAVAKVQTSAPGVSPPPAYSEPQGRPAPRKGPQQIRLTREEINEAARNGMDPRDYARSKYGKW